MRARSGSGKVNAILAVFKDDEEELTWHQIAARLKEEGYTGKMVDPKHLGNYGYQVLIPKHLTRINIPGDRVRVTATVNYKGPALSDTFYASIGNRIVFFDEIWKREVSFNWPATAFFLPRH